MTPLAPALLRRLPGLPDQAIRTGTLARPESWSDPPWGGPTRLLLEEVSFHKRPDPGPG